MKALEMIILFFIIIASVSCNNKDDSGTEPEEGDVPDKSCPCEFYVEPITIQGEAQFFIDVSDYRELYSYLKTRNYMLWRNDRDRDNAYLMLQPDDNSMPIRVDICNFPDFAKEWHSEKGIIVYYEGLMYNRWCENLSLGCRGFCETMILTKLKIRKEE